MLERAREYNKEARVYLEKSIVKEKERKKRRSCIGERYAKGYFLLRMKRMARYINKTGGKSFTTTRTLYKCSLFQKQEEEKRKRDITMKLL